MNLYTQRKNAFTATNDAIMRKTINAIMRNSDDAIMRKSIRAIMHDSINKKVKPWDNRIVKIAINQHYTSTHGVERATNDYLYNDINRKNPSCYISTHSVERAINGINRKNPSCNVSLHRAKRAISDCLYNGDLTNKRSAHRRNLLPRIFCHLMSCCSIRDGTSRLSSALKREGAPLI